MVTIRDARSEDAVRLAEIHTSSWQAAYRGVLSAEFLGALDATSRLDFWTARLARVPPRWAVLVSQVGESVTGFATIGQCQDDDRLTREAGELYAMYIDPVRWGHGDGRGLLLAVEDRFREEEYSDATLWVLRDNVRARRFYKMGGWEADGAKKRMVIGNDAVAAVRYLRGFR